MLKAVSRRISRKRNAKTPINLDVINNVSKSLSPAEIHQRKIRVIHSNNRWVSNSLSSLSSSSNLFSNKLPSLCLLLSQALWTKPKPIHKATNKTDSHCNKLCSNLWPRLLLLSSSSKLKFRLRNSPHNSSNRLTKQPSSNNTTSLFLTISYLLSCIRIPQSTSVPSAASKLKNTVNFNKIWSWDSRTNGRLCSSREIWLSRSKLCKLSRKFASKLLRTPCPYPNSKPKCPSSRPLCSKFSISLTGLAKFPSSSSLTISSQVLTTRSRTMISIIRIECMLAKNCQACKHSGTINTNAEKPIFLFEILKFCSLFIYTFLLHHDTHAS